MTQHDFEAALNYTEVAKEQHDNAGDYHTAIASHYIPTIIRALKVAHKLMQEPVAWQVYNALVKDWTTTHRDKGKLDVLAEQGYKIRPLYAMRDKMLEEVE